MFVLRKLAESVASHKSCQQRKAKVERCGCSRCRYAGFGGITQGASAFSAGTESSRGPVLGPDQAVLRRHTLGSRTVLSTPFLQQRVMRVTSMGFQATSQDDSLFPISQVSASSAWARHSETLLTPDCAAAARAGATYHTKATGRVYSLQSTAPFGDCSDDGFLDLLSCSGSLSPDTSLMGKGWVSNAFGRTNVFPDAW